MLGRMLGRYALGELPGRRRRPGPDSPVMRLLVLGGTHFVGRALVEGALRAGDEVTTLTSGASGPPAAGAQPRHADRRDPVALRAALADDEWDAVVDTWSGAPRHVLTAMDALRGRAGHWTYVSSRSVYRPPVVPGADESAPVVEGDPASVEDEDYAAAKRGGELAALRHDAPVLLARAGLVLGPYENVGRLPFWLDRVARGGRVPVPGPPTLPIQLLDARDLAAWVRRCVVTATAGTFNVVSPVGQVTMGDVLTACLDVTRSDAELVWLTPRQVERAGVEPWTELPLWLPPGHEAAGLHAGDVSAAVAAGFTSRPVQETVADTWAWLQREGMPAGTARGGQGYGVDAARRLLDAAGT